jgi:hypothetical protein
MRAILITLLAGVAFLAVAAPVEPSWRKIENGSFSFSVPDSFKKTDAHGIDSFVEVYVAEGIELSFDYGQYSNNFGDWPKETKFESVKIDGRPARIGTAVSEQKKGLPHSTQVHIKTDGGASLSMFAACRSEKEVALARKIFETIAFNAKNP